jgi:hypothetical protein
VRTPRARLKNWSGGIEKNIDAVIYAVFRGELILVPERDGTLCASVLFFAATAILGKRASGPKDIYKITPGIHKFPNESHPTVAKNRKGH